MAGSTHEREAIPRPRLLFHVTLEPIRLLRVRERIRDYLSMYCASLDDIDDVVLCVEEACTNAIRHSRSSDDLEIEIAFEDEWLGVSVQDHGVGFAIASFDPLIAPDSTALGGRGLYLISQIMDEMDLSCDGGTTVRMRMQVGVPSTAHRRAVFVQEPGPASIPAVVIGERRLFLLLEDLPDGFVALDWEWRIVYANPTALRLLRLPKEKVLGAHVLQLFPEMEGTELDSRGRHAMEQGIPSHFEVYFEPQGTWYELHLYPTASGVSICFNEINERKRRERERNELPGKAEDERARLQAVLDVLPVAVGITDEEGYVIAHNPTVCRLWGDDAPLP